jgi:hypothetical protein
MPFTYLRESAREHGRKTLCLMKLSKKILSIIYVLFLFSSCYAQNDGNISNEAKNNDTLVYFYESNCLNVTRRCNMNVLKIINYDTLIYVSSSEYSGKYEEYRGKLTKINDSIYYVQCFKNLIQGGNREKPFRTEYDTLYFNCDSSFINNVLTIEYSNGAKEEHTIHSTKNQFWINRKLYNHTKDKILISFQYKHPIIDEIVELKIEHYSNVTFGSENYFNKIDDFYILLYDSEVRTINLERGGEYTYGPKFRLKRFTESDKMNRGRDVY